MLFLSAVITNFVTAVNTIAMKVSTVCALLMVAVVSINVISRYIFHYSFSSAEEVARFMMIWFTFLLFPVIQTKGHNIAVDFLVSHLRYSRVGMIIATIIEFSIIIILCFCFYYSIYYVKRSWNVISPGSQIPLGYVFTILPYSFCMAAICCIERMIRFIHCLIHPDCLPQLRRREREDMEIAED